MTTTNDTGLARDTEGQATRPAPRAVTLGTLLVVGLLAGLFGARFVLADGDDVATPAGQAAPAGATAPERIAGLERSLEDTPGDAGLWRELASLLVTEAALTGDPTYHERASEALERAADAGAEGPELTIVDAALQLSLHEFARAEQLATQVLRERPGNAQALGARVDARVETGRYDAAAADLQAMLDNRPNLPALARTSYLRELQGDLDGAAQAMQQAVTAGSALPDELANVTVLLGDLQRRLGDHEAARDSLARAEQLREDLPLAAVLRARLAVADGDLNAAIDHLEDLTDRLPLPDALTLLEEVQAASGDTAGAADTAAVVRTIAALQRDAGQDTDLEMARFEADAGDDPAEAAELARRAHAARPTVHAASALAWALHRDGDTDEAVPFARESLRLGTADAALAYRAAAVLDAAGERAEAAEALALAATDVPSSTPRYAEAIRELADRLEVELGSAW